MVPMDSQVSQDAALVHVQSCIET
eukprot:SAG31_NODE_41621_length_275_cov_0.590909_1_plen_23_part_10